MANPDPRDQGVRLFNCALSAYLQLLPTPVKDFCSWILVLALATASDLHRVASGQQSHFSWEFFVVAVIEIFALVKMSLAGFLLHSALLLLCMIFIMHTPPPQLFYAVAIGRRMGVFRNYDVVPGYTAGYRGARGCADDTTYGLRSKNITCTQNGKNPVPATLDLPPGAELDCCDTDYCNDSGGNTGGPSGPGGSGPGGPGGNGPDGPTAGPGGPGGSDPGGSGPGSPGGKSPGGSGDRALVSLFLVSWAVAMLYA